jgi:hypothetical protein
LVHNDWFIQFPAHNSTHKQLLLCCVHPHGTRNSPWGAAGWHISFDVFERFLASEPIGRIVGPDAMNFGGWQRLNAEYAKQFGIETPTCPPQAAQKS